MIDSGLLFLTCESKMQRPDVYYKAPNGIQLWKRVD